MNDAEFAFPGELRDRLVGAVLRGGRPTADTVDVAERFRLVEPS